MGIGDIFTNEQKIRYSRTGAPDLAAGTGSPGNGLLSIDGRLVGATAFPFTTTNRMGPVGFSCGYAAFDSVDPGLYTTPFRFAGTIRRVVVDISGELLRHDEAELRGLMAQQ